MTVVGQKIIDKSPLHEYLYDEYVPRYLLSFGGYSKSTNICEYLIYHLSQSIMLNDNDVDHKIVYTVFLCDFL